MMQLTPRDELSRVTLNISLPLYGSHSVGDEQAGTVAEHNLTKLTLGDGPQSDAMISVGCAQLPRHTAQAVAGGVVALPCPRDAWQREKEGQEDGEGG